MEQVTLAEAVRIVYDVLMTREGQVIDAELSEERARNIIAALQGLTIGAPFPSKDSVPEVK